MTVSVKLILVVDKAMNFGGIKLWDLYKRKERQRREEERGDETYSIENVCGRSEGAPVGNEDDDRWVKYPRKPTL